MQVSSLPQCTFTLVNRHGFLGKVWLGFSDLHLNQRALGPWADLDLDTWWGTTVFHCS